MCLRSLSLSRILMATWSLVSVLRANLTLAKFPSPRVRPSSYLPTRVLLPPPPPMLMLVLVRDDIFVLSPTSTLTSSFSFSFSLYNLSDQNLFFLQGCQTWDFATLIFLIVWIPNKERKKKTRRAKQSPLTDWNHRGGGGGGGSESEIGLLQIRVKG